jgi:plasmid stability protein
MVMIAVRLEPEMFEQVRQIAARRGHSMAEQVRALVEVGLVVEEEIGAEE